MITPTKQLATEALEELSDVLDFIASERGTNDSMYLALSAIEDKLEIIQKCLVNPAKQQSDFEIVKSYVEEGKLPPLGSVKTGIQYINSKKGT